MAIKGKTKAKTKPSVAKPPKPVPVEVKPPFFLRRPIVLILGLIAGLIVSAVAVWAFIGVRNENRTKARARHLSQARSVVQRWQTIVDGEVSKIGSAPPGAPPAVFSSLAPTLASMAKGQTPKDAATVGSTVQSEARSAADSLDAVKLVDMIRNHGFDVEHTNYMLNSQARMVEALRLYERIGTMVGEAAKNPKASVILVADAQDVQATADRLFQEGYSDYQQALFFVGIFPQAQTPGIPGGFGS